MEIDMEELVAIVDLKLGDDYNTFKDCFVSRQVIHRQMSPETVSYST